MAFDYSDLQYLSVPLPANVQKFKLHGDLERAGKAIQIYLNRDIPQALRTRLQMELEILHRLPKDYIYPFDAAVKRCQQYLSDFTAEELSELQDQNDVEWIFLNGDVCFKSNFLENLISCYPQYRARCTDPSKLSNPENMELLKSELDKMRQNGKAGWHFKMRESIRVNPETARTGIPVKVHLPLPIEYAQVKNFKLLAHTDAETVTVAGNDAGQRTICFEGALKENQEFFVEYEFDNIMIYRDPDPDKVCSAQPSFYTEELLPHIRFTPYIQALTREIVGQETNPLKKARAIYDYVTSHIMYSYMPGYFTILDIAEYAASGWKGDCGVQALLFITLCRCAGVPARWQAGIYTHPLGAGNHDWAQYYVAPYGWLYADCSFGSSAYRAGDEQRRAFYACNLEPFRMPSNQEFQQPFDPEKQQLRSDPYDNQSGEIEYFDRALEPEEYESDYAVLESHPIDF